MELQPGKRGRILLTELGFLDQTDVDAFGCAVPALEDVQRELAFT